VAASLVLFLCTMDSPTAFCSLFPELLEHSLFRIGNIASFRAASHVCAYTAAPMAATPPPWRALLAEHVNMTSIPTAATGWESDFYCYWDGSFGDPTDAAAFDPPLTRVPGWAAVAPPDDGGTFLYVDNRDDHRGACRGAAATTDAVPSDAADATGCPDDALRNVEEEEHPQELFTAVALMTMAGAALQEPTALDLYGSSFNLWGSEAPPVPHIWAVRVAAGDVAWPPPIGGGGAPPSDVEVQDAARALLAAAGAADEAASPIHSVPDWNNPTGAASGQPAAALYRTAIAEPADRWVGTHSPARSDGGHPRPTPAHLRRRLRAANKAVGQLLGDRPALLFTFGRYQMNPMGGVIAVRSSPTLFVGLLVELIAT